MSPEDVCAIREAFFGHPFIFQIGTRNAQNYALLTAVGETGVPVLLKRGKGSTVAEMIGAARYVTRGGSPVLMCERGIMTFSDVGRATADFLAIIEFQKAGYLTVFDPSHAAGRADLVSQLALAGVAVGANGLLVEVDHNGCDASCDGKQALSFGQFEDLMQQAREIETIIRRETL